MSEDAIILKGVCLGVALYWSADRQATMDGRFAAPTCVPMWVCLPPLAFVLVTVIRTPRLMSAYACIPRKSLLNCFLIFRRNSPRRTGSGSNMFAMLTVVPT